MVYCYDKSIVLDENIVREMNVAKRKGTVVVYDCGNGAFFDLSGQRYELSKKDIVIPRTSSIEVSRLIEAIEKKGGTPLNDVEAVTKIELWPLYYKTKRNVFIFEARELLDYDVVKKLEKLYGDKMFIKTVEKNFNGIIDPKILENQNCNFGKALHYHPKELFMVSDYVDIKEDRLGLKEYRCVIKDCEVYNISRMTNEKHKIEPKALALAQEIAQNYKGCYVVDLMERADGEMDVTEFNPIESADMYLYNSVVEKSRDLLHRNPKNVPKEALQRVIPIEEVKEDLDSKCNWNAYGGFAADLRSICTIGELGGIFALSKFSDPESYGCQTKSFKLIR